MKHHNPNHRCEHGYLLWWNYGDGKPRHMFDDPNYGYSMAKCNNPYPDS